MCAYSLIYVSRSLLAPDEARDAIGDIISVSAERNAREDVTGALLFSGANFVQILEGPQAAVLGLMADIQRDPRHDRIDIIEARADVPRAFDRWSMAYVGDAVFVQARVDELLNAHEWQSGLPTALRRMRGLIREFVDNAA